MIGYPAELKARISWKTFEEVLIRLSKAGKEMNYLLNQRIVYFADTQNLDVYHSNKILIRFRWNNKVLESVIKIRKSFLYDIKKIRKEFANLDGHILKIDGDWATSEKTQWGLSIKYRFSNVDPAFSFFKTPADFLTTFQKKFLRKLAPKLNVKQLKFGIPIESNAYTFDTDYKEFTSITLEEWRLPRLLGNKIYEISMKTDTYTDEKTQKHFSKMLDDLDVIVSNDLKLKTQRYYRSYFNL